MKKRSWTETQLRDAVKRSKSVRNVIKLLGLKPAGGNYAQLQKYIKELNIGTGHFTGRAWNRGLKGIGSPILSLNQILVKL